MATNPQHVQSARGERFSPAEAIDSAAVEAYRPYASVGATLDNLYSQLDAYYHVHDTPGTVSFERANYNVVRGLHQALGTPLSHLVTVEASRSLLAYLAGGGPPEPVEYNNLLDPIDIPERPLWDRVTRMGMALTAQAFESAIGEIETDEHHPHRALWEWYCAVYPEFVASERKFRPFERPDNPRKGLFLAQLIAWFDAEIVARIRHGSQIEELDERAAGMEILRVAGPISWVASTNRHKVGALARHSEQGCPYAAESQPTAGAEGSGGLAPWHDTSLQAGPSQEHGRCLGAITLSAQSESGRLAIEAIYDAQAQHLGSLPRQHTRQEGSSTAAELRTLHLGLLLVSMAESPNGSVSPDIVPATPAGS
ncbi:MAG TPA: hypothetical protein VLF40_03135 [Candidatus Saccharimonadales bacterium]|nr:hypothetical protein [Candidatus Saccharimonadales bacterium]